MVVEWTRLNTVPSGGKRDRALTCIYPVSHVNIQMNAISYCMCHYPIVYQNSGQHPIIHSVATQFIHAVCLPFATALSHSFLLYNPRFIRLYVLLLVAMVALVGWLVVGSLTFPLSIDSSWGSANFAEHILSIPYFFSNIYQSPFFLTDKKRKTKLFFFIESVFVYFYISFCMSWRNVLFVVHFGRVILMSRLNEFPKMSFLTHLFVYQERGTFNMGKYFASVCLLFLLWLDKYGCFFPLHKQR